MPLSSSSTELFLSLSGLLLVGLLALTFRRRLQQPPREREFENATEQLADIFVIKPYLQLGNSPRLCDEESVEVHWQTAPAGHFWRVQFRTLGGDRWREAPVETRAFHVHGVDQRLHLSSKLAGLAPGRKFEYRLLLDERIAFTGSARARAAFDQPFTVAVAGDFGEPRHKNEQRIANRVAFAQPDLLFVPGDVVYTRGRVSEYMAKFFPVYNADRCDPENGGPVIRSVISLAAPGNHDVGMPNAAEHSTLDAMPDLYGYFYFWSQPLNGPLTANSTGNKPFVEGSSERVQQFLSNAGDRFPQMTCFSFDWGNSHWVVLDSNGYMDWSDERLLAWLEADLAAAREARWKIVSFHHPPFSSNFSHPNEQRMRLIAPVLERHGVDVVFTGHNHCYERTWPLRFQPSVTSVPVGTDDCPVPGCFSLDTTYDGVVNRKPNGIIYVTDGAAGASLHRAPSDGDWQVQPFSCKFDQDNHSFTLLSFDGGLLTARQIGADGAELDRWSISK